MTRDAVTPVPGVAPPGGQYSHAVRGPADGTTVWLAGQVGTDADGKVVVGGAEAQARQVMENMAAVLAAAGGDFDDVVRITTFLVDRGDREAVARARQERFRDPPPASTLLVVSGLANPDFLVEIEAVAVIPPGR